MAFGIFRQAVPFNQTFDGILLLDEIIGSVVVVIVKPTIFCLVGLGRFSNRGGGGLVMAFRNLMIAHSWYVFSREVFRGVYMSYLPRVPRSDSSTILLEYFSDGRLEPPFATD